MLFTFLYSSFMRNEKVKGPLFTLTLFLLVGHVSESSEIRQVREQLQ